MSWPAMKMLPPFGSSKPEIMRRVVVLPQPLGPSKREDPALFDGQRHIVDRGEVAEAFRHVRELENRHCEISYERYTPVPISRSMPTIQSRTKIRPTVNSIRTTAAAAIVRSKLVRIMLVMATGSV